MAIGIIALFTGKTDTIILISVFGALTLYVVAMISVFRLRKLRPEMPRPFHTPLYPFTPAIALVISLICLGTMAWFNRECAGIYAAIVLAGYGWYFLGAKQKVAV
jgi:ethanolamine permease